MTLVSITVNSNENIVHEQLQLYVKCLLTSLFADDTKLYAAILNETSYTCLSDDLTYLQSWTEEMQMTFNFNKCKLKRK